MINASNNPFSCEPAVIGLNNQILELGTISRVDDTFTFSVGFKWEINSLIFQNTTTFDYTPAAATTGYKRIDIAVLNTNNEIEFLAGTESNTIALRPTIPLNNLLLTQWNIDGATIEDSETPLVGSDYVKKSFAQAFAFNGTGADNVIPLDPLGRSEIRLLGTGLTSISGFDLSLITGNASAEVPYIGKIYMLVNLTGADVTLKHSDGSADILFLAKESTDLVIPNGERLTMIYGVDFEEAFRSWGGTSGVSSSKKSFTIEIPINQNIAASASWYSRLTITHNIFNATFSTNGSLTPTNDFSDHGNQTPCNIVPFDCKIKSVIIRGHTNSTATNVRFVVIKSDTLVSNQSTILNSDIIADKTVSTSSPTANVYHAEFIGSDLDTTVTVLKGSEIRLLFNNNNVASNLYTTVCLIEFEEL